MRTPGTRVLPICLGLLAVLLLWQAICAPLYPFDEPLWYLRCARIWPCQFHSKWAYGAAVDLPAVNRWLYGSALRATGLHTLPCPRADYSKTLEQNRAEGRVAPWRAVMVMRSVNVVVLCAMVGTLYCAAYLVVGSRWWALAAVIPVVASKTFSMRLTEKVAPDAMLLCMMALTLAPWLAWHLRGDIGKWKMGLYLGLLAGLATATKLNGGLLVIALVVYFAITCGKWERVFVPLMTTGAAFAVFVLVNPVMWYGYIPVFSPTVDMLARRFVIMAIKAAQYGPMSFTDFAQQALPTWPLLPLMLAVFFAAWRQPWFLPVACWGGALAIGTFFTIGVPVQHYLAPLELGLYFPAALALVSNYRSHPNQGQSQMAFP
jgi:hypothetical protein